MAHHATSLVHEHPIDTKHDSSVGLTHGSKVFSRRRESKVEDDLARWRGDHLNERLTAYSEDLASWINEAVKHQPDVAPVRPDHFLDDTRNGAALLYIANAIELGEKQWRRLEKMPEKKPTTFRIHKGAAPGSWKARDNVAQFINWARRLGVPEVVLFETNDLAEEHSLRQVLYCLMDVARLQHGIEPPALVRMEQELHRALAGEISPNAEDLTPDIKALLLELEMDPTLADERDEMGRYFFGRDSPVFVRKLNDHLLVPLDDDWITLKHYLTLIGNGKARELDLINRRAHRHSGSKEAASARQAAEADEANRLAEEQRLHALDQRVQQLIEWQGNSQESLGQKERELAEVRSLLEAEQRAHEQAEEDARRRMLELEEEKRRALAQDEAALADVQRRLEAEQRAQQEERQRREEAQREYTQQAETLSLELDSANERLARLSEALEEEMKSKEKLVAELNDTNEKMRDMRKKIARERFGRAATAAIAQTRLKHLQEEREVSAQQASELKRMQSARDQAEKRAAEAEARAAMVEELSELERSQSALLQDMSGLAVSSSQRAAVNETYNSQADITSSGGGGGSARYDRAFAEAFGGVPGSYDPATGGGAEPTYDYAQAPSTAPASARAPGNGTKATARRRTARRKRFVLLGVKEVVTVTRTKYFSDNSEPQQTVEKHERQLKADEIALRNLEAEAYRLWRQRGVGAEGGSTAPDSTPGRTRVYAQASDLSTPAAADPYGGGRGSSYTAHRTVVVDDEEKVTTFRTRRAAPRV